jgi:hypothetical protein
MPRQGGNYVPPDLLLEYIQIQRRLGAALTRDQRHNAKAGGGTYGAYKRTSKPAILTQSRRIGSSPQLTGMKSKPSILDGGKAVQSPKTVQLAKLQRLRAGAVRENSDMPPRPGFG